MSRDYESIMRSADSVQTTITKNEVISLPPGYWVGFDVRLRPDYTVLIKAGAANVGGSLVQMSDDHQLADADWVAPKINSDRHYYIYLSKAGEFKIDIVAPVWNNDLLYYEQPDMNWRAIGKIFLVNSQIVYAVRQVEVRGNTVTIASADFVGEADYYCDGENDFIFFNMASDYLSSAYDGGLISVLPGDYHIYSQITLSRKIHIVGSGDSSRLLKEGSCIRVFFAEGEFGIVIRDLKIESNTNTVDTGMIIFYECSDVIVKNCTIKASLSYAIEMLDCSGVEISKNFIDGGNIGQDSQMAGIYCHTSTEECKSVRILDNVIKNYQRDTPSAWNLYGIVVSETNSKPIKAIIARNVIRDFSMAGVGVGYVVGIYIGANNVSCSENKIENLKNSVTTTNIEAIWVVSGFSGICVLGNHCYDNGSDTGIANTNSNNFYDAGTDTQVYSNSWQSPVSGQTAQGELHWLPQSTATLAGYVLQNITTTAAWSSVSLGTLVPVGTKSIYANVGIYASSSGAGAFYHACAFSNDYSATPQYGTYHPLAMVRDYADAAGELISDWRPMTIPVDSNRKFYHYAFTRFNASYCNIYVALCGYTC